MKNSIPVTLSELPCKKGNIRVVRDDLLDGGAKSRALRSYLVQMAQQGFREFVYASPFCGYAQVALAYACKELNLSATIYAEGNPESAFSEPHLVSKLAECAGASLRIVESLEKAEQCARRHAALSINRYKIPLGLDCKTYRYYLREAIELVWDRLTTDSSPSRLWLSLGSGTLARELRSILPMSVELCVVDVHVLSSQDFRIEQMKHSEGVRYFSAREVFHEASRQTIPIPSNSFYDAKVWSFLNDQASAGDVWWNIAR